MRCIDCVTAYATHGSLCADCAKQRDDDKQPQPRRKITRQERLEALADRGIDTHEDYEDRR